MTLGAREGQGRASNRKVGEANSAPCLNRERGPSDSGHLV